MTLREFILNEGCCGNKCDKSEFDAAKDFEEKDEVAKDEGNFEFLIKAKVAGLDEAEAKKRLEDALDGFDVKIKAKKAEKKEDEEKEDESEDEEAAKKFKGKGVIRKVTAIEHPEEGGEDAGAACAVGAKKFKKEECCPQCGKKFSECDCK